MKLLLLSGIWACGARRLQAAGYSCWTRMQQLLPLLGNDYAIPFTERRAAQSMRESRTRQITEFWACFERLLTSLLRQIGLFEAAIRTALGMSVGNELAWMHSNVEWWNQHTDSRSTAFDFSQLLTCGVSQTGSGSGAPLKGPSPGRLFL